VVQSRVTESLSPPKEVIRQACGSLVATSSGAPTIPKHLVLQWMERLHVFVFALKHHNQLRGISALNDYAVPYRHSHNLTSGAKKSWSDFQTLADKWR
jgi:hypothetical protein